MLLHNYVETLLGSKVKVKILRTLIHNPSKQFTTRELAEHVGVSHTGAGKALSDLYEMNAVTLRAVGKSQTVSLNAESYTAKILSDLFGAEDETLPEIVRLVKRQLKSPRISVAAIFGSAARGEETPLSDIDLLIVTDDRESAEAAADEAQRMIAKRFRNALTPYILTDADLDDPRRTPVLREIRAKNIPIVGEIRHVGKDAPRREEKPLQLHRKG